MLQYDVPHLMHNCTASKDVICMEHVVDVFSQHHQALFRNSEGGTFVKLFHLYNLVVKPCVREGMLQDFGAVQHVSLTRPKRERCSDTLSDLLK